MEASTYPEYAHILIYIHLATILPAFVIGTYQMIRKKGTAQHKLLGRIYLVLMLFTAAITLFIPSVVGSWKLFNHFGLIHILSFVTIFSCIGGYLAIKSGNINLHKFFMISLYVGGLLVAGFFTFVPGRLLGDLVFG